MKNESNSFVCSNSLFGNSLIALFVCQCESRLRLLRSKGFSELVIVLEAERGPNDAPDAGQHVGDDVDVGLIPGHANVVVCVEEGHQSVPDGEDREDVVQHSGDVQHLGQFHHHAYEQLLKMLWHSTFILLTILRPTLPIHSSRSHGQLLYSTLFALHQ